ncbi:hypothetical protein J4206_02850 [Candidatus Woesearchaeota archaeon]|nr:hypothetical protein [Candidatus Woesearchaeota archaeon]
MVKIAAKALEQIIIDKHETYTDEDIPIAPRVWLRDDMTGRELEQDLIEYQGFVNVTTYSFAKKVNPTSITWQIREHPELAVKVISGKNHYYLLTPKAQEVLAGMFSLLDNLDITSQLEILRTEQEKDPRRKYSHLEFADVCSVSHQTVNRWITEGMPTSQATITRRNGQPQKVNRAVSLAQALRWLERRQYIYSIPQVSLVTGFSDYLIRDLVREGFLPVFNLGHKLNPHLYVPDVNDLQQRIEAHVIADPRRMYKFKGDRIFIHIVNARNTLPASDFHLHRLNQRYMGLGHAIRYRFGTLEDAFDATSDYLARQGRENLAPRFTLDAIKEESESEKKKSDDKLRAETLQQIKDLSAAKKKVTWDTVSEKYPDIAYALKKLGGFHRIFQNDTETSYWRLYNLPLGKNEVIAALVNEYDIHAPMTQYGMTRHNYWLAHSAVREFGTWKGAIDAVKAYLAEKNDSRASDFTLEKLAERAKEDERTRRYSFSDVFKIIASKEYTLQQVYEVLPYTTDEIDADIAKGTLEVTGEKGNKEGQEVKQLKVRGKALIDYLYDEKGWLSLEDIVGRLNISPTDVLKCAAVNVDAAVIALEPDAEYMLFNPIALYRFKEPCSLLTRDDFSNLRNLVPDNEQFSQDDLSAFDLTQEMLRQHMSAKLRQLARKHSLTSEKLRGFLDTIIQANDEMKRFTLRDVSAITGLPYSFIYQHRKSGLVNAVNLGVSRSVGVDDRGLVYLAVEAMRRGVDGLEDMVLKRKPHVSLTPAQLDELSLLMPIVDGRELARLYNISHNRLLILLHTRPTDLKFLSRAPYSNERVQYAADLFRDVFSASARRILLEQVFQPLASYVADYAAEQYRKTMHPLFQFYLRAYGLTKDDRKLLFIEVERVAREYCYGILLDNLVRKPDEFSEVLSRQEAVSQWLYHQAQQYISEQTKPFMEEMYSRISPYLSEQQRRLIFAKYMTGAKLAGKEAAIAIGISMKSASTYEIPAARKAESLSKEVFDPDKFLADIRKHFNSLDELERWAA